MTEDDRAPEIIEAAPRVAAYTQLLEISAALSAGKIAPEDADALWDELDAYLVAETERFEAYPSFDWPPYTEGLALVCRGLERLRGAARAARTQGLDDQTQADAEAGSDDVARGQRLLVAAHGEAVRAQAPADSAPDQVTLCEDAVTLEGDQATPS